MKADSILMLIIQAAGLAKTVLDKGADDAATKELKVRQQVVSLVKYAVEHSLKPSEFVDIGVSVFSKAVLKGEFDQYEAAELAYEAAKQAKFGDGEDP